MLGPALACHRAVVIRTSRDEPAHAMGDERQLRTRRRPLLDKGLDQIGKCTPVGRDVQTAVVV